MEGILQIAEERGDMRFRMNTQNAPKGARDGRTVDESDDVKGPEATGDSSALGRCPFGIVVLESLGAAGRMRGRAGRRVCCVAAGGAVLLVLLVPPHHSLINIRNTSFILLHQYPNLIRIPQHQSFERRRSPCQRTSHAVVRVGVKLVIFVVRLTSKVSEVDFVTKDTANTTKAFDELGAFLTLVRDEL